MPEPITITQTKNTMGEITLVIETSEDDKFVKSVTIEENTTSLPTSSEFIKWLAIAVFKGMDKVIKTENILETAKEIINKKQ